VKVVIKYLNPKKALSYDLITNKILEKLPEIGIKYITQLCNADLDEASFYPTMEDSTNYY